MSIIFEPNFMRIRTSAERTMYKTHTSDCTFAHEVSFLRSSISMFEGYGFRKGSRTRFAKQWDFPSVDGYSGVVAGGSDCFRFCAKEISSKRCNIALLDAHVCAC